MNTDSLSSMGSAASYLDRQLFGAEVVSKTLNNLNGDFGSSSMSPVDRQSFGAAVVDNTLKLMNSGTGASNMGGMSQTYNFAKDVLGGYMSGVGALTDLSV